MSLVGEGGVGEAVAEDELASGESRAEHLCNVLGTRRFKVATRADSSLFVDVTPRAANEVLDRLRAEGTSIASIILAIGALTMLVFRRRRPEAERRLGTCDGYELKAKWPR